MYIYIYIYIYTYIYIKELEFAWATVVPLTGDFMKEPSLKTLLLALKLSFAQIPPMGTSAYLSVQGFGFRVWVKSMVAVPGW